MAKRRFARNKRELAALINIGPQALKNLFARNDYPPQVPGQGYDIAQWQRYADNNIAYWKKQNPSPTIASRANLRDEAYIRRQEVEREKLQYDLDVKRGKYSPKVETQQQVMTCFGLLVREGDKAFLHELPPRLEGLSAGDIAKLLGKRWQEIRDRVATSLEGKNGHSGNGRVAVA